MEEKSLTTGNTGKSFFLWERPSGRDGAASDDNRGLSRSYGRNNQ